jgi:hypothetical protein
MIRIIFVAAMLAALCVVPAADAASFQKGFTITVTPPVTPPPTVTGIALPNTTVPAGTTGTVSAVNITMSDGSTPPASLTISVFDCAADFTGCVPSAKFALSSPHPPANLIVNPGLGAGGIPCAGPSNCIDPIQIQVQ